ncbi:MAG: RecX family transcriptional regulator [Acidobacteria bacterium]|nr:RecX family transcriptional regulator [Acidobacteriota bacterium]
MSAAGLRARLLDREHSPEDVEAVIAQLLETHALDDARVARAYARTAATVKGRGRLRVMRELHAMGIAGDVAAAALAEVFGDLDERTLIAKALQKKLRGRTRLEGRAEQARLYQQLMRLGFTPAGIAAALRKLGGPDDSIE